MRLKNSFLLMFTAMLPALSALAIQVPNLTGTWQGKIVCSGTAHGAGKIKHTFNNVKLYITQNSNTISIDRNDGGDLDASPIDFTGFVIADLKKPTLKGQAAVTNCNSSNDIFTGGYSELTNLSVAADSEKAKGTLKGSSIYSYPSSLGHALEVGQCKWQFKLIDPTDPLIAPNCF